MSHEDYTTIGPGAVAIGATALAVAAVLLYTDTAPAVAVPLLCLGVVLTTEWIAATWPEDGGR